MAGMFYSLQEAAERLNKTEEELQQIVKDGKLREFRDGPNLLFKIDEVEALMPEIAAVPSEEAPAPEILQPEPPELEIPEIEAPTPEEAAPEIAEPEALESETPEHEVPELEMPTSEELAAEIPEPEPPQLDIPELEIPQQPTPEGFGAEILEPEGLEAETPELEIPEPEAPTPEEPTAEIPEPEVPVSEGTEPSDMDEILLAPGTGIPAVPSELTDADTALTGEGINVLGETDRDYDVTDDTMAETVGGTGATGTVGSASSSEASLEEIESDVNLDSFGSGSGLLDLSLQADDTSLGGILDEIYTADESEEEEPAEAGTVEEVVAEADQIAEDFAAPQPSLDMALAGATFEVPPDKQSNILGGLLFLPILILLYTAIAAVSGLRGVASSAVSAVQSNIWYVVIGLTVAALGVVGAAFTLGKDTSDAAKKTKKAKKPKKVKKPKEPKKPKKKK